MKKRYIIISAWIALFVVSVSAQSINPAVDTLLMGPGYVNEIYYSMSNGKQTVVNRKQWDIAFRASRMSASILTNDAANNNSLGINGVELYTYENGDASSWASFDTTGYSTWKLLVNSTTDWETGAFCQNQSGHPDYGWGKYNTATHDVMGDSLYLIKLRDGSFRKLWIIRKYSSLNQYEFRYAGLDGSGDTTVLLDCAPYSDRNFIGFSITTNQVVDFEQTASSTWDILFTKYMYTYPDGVLYPVTGVLSNYGVKVNTFHPVATDYRMWDVNTMDSTRSPIGWEWKYLDNMFVYHVEDSLVYFVQDVSGNIHRLVFKGFAGSSSGQIILETELISMAGISDNNVPGMNLAVYPNPASEKVNLMVNPGAESRVLISVSDLSGRILLSSHFRVQPGELNTLNLPLDTYPDGLYVINLKAGNTAFTRKLVVRH